MITKFIKNTAGLTFKRVQSISQIQRFQNTFLSASNICYIESLYEKWLNDKSSVSPDFAAYFQALQRGVDPQMAHHGHHQPGQAITFGKNQSPFVSQQLKIRMMIERYRAIGHQFAKINPLGIQKQNFIGKIDKSVLGIEAFEFTPEQLSYKYSLKSGRNQNSEVKKYTVKDMQNFLQAVYCQSAGFQYTHLLDKQQRDFITLALQSNLEQFKVREPTKQQSLKAFDRMCKDQTFIDFLSNKFGNFKRFGIQGLNSATCALQQLAQNSAKLGADKLILGMAHRGRLNTLHCVFDKPAQTIFKQFLQKGSQQYPDDYSGDVKYHLGRTVKKNYDGKQITLTMLPNPSHLQTVNPLVYGSVRAQMQALGDMKGDKSVGVIIHGDAAMAGQGIVYQCAQMQDLKDYTPKGIIHIVMNNQIGFTTNPQQARSAYYCTQVAKIIGAPVFHVNANQPDVLDKCMKLAVQYRFKFKKDVFIDIVGFRRYGHNEQDQPFFTQPKMYQIIKNKPTLFQAYCQKLLSKGILTEQQITAKKSKYTKIYQQEYAKVLNDKFDKFQQVQQPLKKIKTVNNQKTGVSKNVLSQVFQKITTWPADFNIHPTIKKIYDERKKNFANNEPLDWATMESLAFATLLHDGYGVRLSGQDVERGTFSHRHAFISDQKRDIPKHFFLRNISQKATVTNSHLSQYAVLGFEYGYTLTNVNNLCIWQAQFGDFANGAAIMIDNYIVSGQAKWRVESGIVMNLPHGMDGQGPQHSSARMQRFLHMSDDNCDVNQNVKYQDQMKNCNIQVVSCSTTANYFHVLRRQMLRNYRKPLILFNSKKLLKYKPANRTIDQILEGTEFTPVYSDDAKIPVSGVKKDIAIVRIQQVAPFPVQHIKKVLSVYGNNVQFAWAQQQHENYGAFNFVYPRLKKALGKPIKFYGRSASASTANGKLKAHKKENEILLQQIFE